MPILGDKGKCGSLFLEITSLKSILCYIVQPFVININETTRESVPFLRFTDANLDKNLEMIT
jgi:hypothetical protein